MLLQRPRMHTSDAGRKVGSEVSNKEQPMFQEYRERYRDFLLSVNQIDVVSIVSRLVLADFPSQLPQEQRGVYEEAIRQLESIRPGQIADLSFEDRRLASLVMIHVINREDAVSTPVDFYQVVVRQQVIMIFAYLDAFIADSVRVICRCRPSILRSQKLFTVDRILSAGDWDQLMTELVDDYVREFNAPNVAKRLQYMRKQLGVKIHVAPKDIEFLDEAEHIRHAFVHNGGRADTGFMRKLKGVKLAVGELVVPDREYVSHLHELAVNLGGDIYGSVCENHLGTKLDAQNMVWKTVTQKRK